MQYLQKYVAGRGLQLSSEAVSPSWHSPFPLPPIPLFFYSLAHSPTQRHRRNSFPVNQLRTLFIATEGVPLSPHLGSRHYANCHTVRPTLFSSLPRYLLTSFPLGALRGPLATLFPPWLANASANTSLPI